MNAPPSEPRASRPAAGQTVAIPALDDGAHIGANERAAHADRQLAALAAARGVRVRVLQDPAEHHAAAAVLQRIWAHPGGAPLAAELLRAFSYTGNYVGAVFDRGEMVAVATAFHAGDHLALHSHIAGVLPGCQGRSLGYLLKLHQRAWALRHGIDAIAWTFDPLIRRNAHFNLVKLGAAATAYLPDFYGAMADRVNAGDRSDRLLVEWDLAGPALGAPTEPAPDAAVVLFGDADGHPISQSAGGGDRLIGLPPDVEALRLRDPAAAARWRMALREALVTARRDGHRIIGLDRSGNYVTRRIDRPPPATSPC